MRLEPTAIAHTEASPVVARLAMDMAAEHLGVAVYHHPNHSTLRSWDNEHLFTVYTGGYRTKDYTAEQLAEEIIRRVTMTRLGVGQ